MGGQSLPPAGGVAADFAGAQMDVDTSGQAYCVMAGARWRQVIAGLDTARLSPAVTQSSNDFAVGAAISVNAHGWPAPRGPVGSTVRGLTVMLADGSLVECSPEREGDLFRLVIGGYGLVGVVVEAELQAAPNVQLRPAFTRFEAGEAGSRFVEAATRAETRMAYGRLDVRRPNFLKEVLICTYDEAGPPSPLEAPNSFKLAGSIFRGQTRSDLGKDVRWFSEAELLPTLSAPSSRNTLLNTPVAALGLPRRGSTDILHEYFLPPAALEIFLATCRREVPASGLDLLNITLRYVKADQSSVMGYAPQDRIAAVMFFDQRMSGRGENAMRALTERLIEAALAVGGSFYLPYRLHARPDQLRRAYPQTDAFAAEKRRLDPGLLFRNLMWDHYFSQT